MKHLKGALIALFGLSMMGVVQAAPMPVRDASGRLTSAEGLSLYVYDRDTIGQASACVGPCAALWPPYLGGAGAKAMDGFSLIKRSDDGRLQWAWHGHPLYRYAGDSRPGEISGDRINGVWHLAR
jgi:predicted lipoprotein with Yx(FWY)xxD motif